MSHVCRKKILQTLASRLSNCFFPSTFSYAYLPIIFSSFVELICRMFVAVSFPSSSNISTASKLHSIHWVRSFQISLWAVSALFGASSTWLLHWRLSNEKPTSTKTHSSDSSSEYFKIVEMPDSSRLLALYKITTTYWKNPLIYLNLCSSELLYCFDVSEVKIVRAIVPTINSSKPLG